MANFEARKVLMKDAQGRYVIPFTGAVETVNGQKPDENGNVVIEGVDTTTLLTKTAAAETYLSKTDAASTYLRVDTAAGTFLSKTDAASTYLTPSQANAAYLGIGDKAVSAETADNAVSATMASTAISDVNGNAIATTYATKTELTEKVNGCLPLSGGTMAGNVAFTSGAVGSGANEIVVLASPDGIDNGTRAVLALRCDDSSSAPGSFVLAARNSSAAHYLVGLVDGTLKWDESQVFLPAGAVFAYAGNSTPYGCLLCNGAEVSRTTYAVLFAAIGTTYGAGNGSTTFNLPNLTDRFIQGSGTAGTYKSAGLPNLTGGLINMLTDGYANGSNGMLSITDTANPFYNQPTSSGIGRLSQSFMLNASTQSSVYGNSDTVQPPALTMRYYIKY